MEARNVEVYDLEVLSNCFTCATVNADDENYQRTFVIWKSSYGERNDLQAFLEYLKSPGLKQIGFNNVKFDYQIVHYILCNESKFLRMRPEQVTLEIYYFVQKLMDEPFPPCPAYKISIPQRDLYLLHHFDNKNKAVSLKALQINMHWPNVMDSPFDWNSTIQTEEDVNLLLKYNMNDSLSTRAFYWKSQAEINLRLALTDKYGIDLRNASNSKIGQEIMLYRLSKKMNLDMKTIRNMGKDRYQTSVGGVIIPEARQKLCKEFQKVIAHFDTLYITDGPLGNGEDEDNEKMTFSVLYDNMQYDFGVGGLHAVRPQGVYAEKEGYALESADVVSYYPTWIIEWHFAPEQFGEAFVEVYTDFRQERKLYKKGTAENISIKYALNGNTGKLRDKYSPLRDTRANLQITINGQLMLALLCQMVTEAGATVVMANTDGLEMFCPDSKRDIIKAVMKEWERIIRMELEYKGYEKLFIRDVNNYIGVYKDGKTYNKGAYEWREYDEYGNKLLEWHKDHSMLAVPRAVQEYLVNRTPFEETFAKCPPQAFFIGKRAKSGGKFEIRTVKDGSIESLKLNKTVRYYISKTGGYLYKIAEGEYKKTKRTKIDSPWKVTSMMEYNGESIHDNIDFRYYKKECWRLIRPILNTQISAVHGLNLTENTSMEEAREVQASPGLFD